MVRKAATPRATSAPMPAIFRFHMAPSLSHGDWGTVRGLDDLAESFSDFLFEESEGM